MSLYSRVHTPNSPLLPLSPIPSSSTFLSPHIASQARRRSFTPNRLNVLPPPNVSPIGPSPKISPNVSRIDLQTPKVKYSMSSSSASSFHVSRRSFTPNNLNFITPSNISPIVQAKLSPNISCTDWQMAQPTYSLYETPQRYSSDADAINTAATTTTAINSAGANAAAALQYDCYTPFPSTNLNVSHNSTTPSLFEETFTVMSILKEINMQKYANLFVTEEVDLFVFLMLTYEDMIELGIEDGDRPILMGAIRCFTEFFSPENSFL